MNKSIKANIQPASMLGRNANTHSSADLTAQL